VVGVSSFIDTSLVRLSTPDGLRALVFPETDTGRARIRTLLSAVYPLPDATVHTVVDVAVLELDCQRPSFATVRRTGNWLQVVPVATRTDFTMDTAVEQPRWTDLLAELSVTVVVDADPGGLGSFELRDLPAFATLAEFQAAAPGLDLAAFMATHRLSTVDDLRAAFHYQGGTVRLAERPPFDPADPANRRVLPLPVAVLIRDAIDLVATLRDVRLLAERAGYPRQVAGVDATAAHAPLVVLPTAAVADSGLTAEQITEFLAGQHVLAVFDQP
jgi:hypothetical protein